MAATAIPGTGTSSDSRLMSNIMIAELAGRRGQLDEALAGYLRAYPLSSDARVAERAARLAIFSRAWPEAEAAIDYWLVLEPDSAEAPDLRAQVQLRQGRSADAASSFLDGIERSDNTPDAWAQLTAVLLQDPDPVAALAVAEDMAAQAPDDPEAQLLLARLALQSGDRSLADAAIDRALELAPGDPAAQLLRAQREADEGDIDAALQTLTQARETSPDDPRLELGEAQLLVEAGRDEDARAAIVDIGVRLSGDDDAASSETMLSIAGLAMQIGAIDEAETWFDRLDQRGDYVEQARFQLARISDQRGDADTAADRYEAVPPGELYVGAQVRAAELRAAAGDLETARERLQTLRANVPDPDIAPQLVAAEGRLVQQSGQYQAALDVLSQGLEDFPDNGSLLYSRALTADAAGQSDMLEKDLTRLIELEPDNAHALNALGYHLVDENTRLDEAEGYVEKARTLLPNDPAIADSLGWLRYRQGRNEEAITLLEQAWQQLPDPEIALHLIEVLVREGQDDEARAVQAQALEQAPDNEQLQQIIEQLAQ